MGGEMRDDEEKRMTENNIVTWLNEQSDYLKMHLREQYDPAPDGAQFDFSTIEIATECAKELAAGLDALAVAIQNPDFRANPALTNLDENFLEKSKRVQELDEAYRKTMLVLRVLGLAAEHKILPRSTYVKQFYPDAYGGQGYVEFTSDIREAKRFFDVAAALAFLRTQSVVRPLRPDGKPNRPLTAYNVAVERVPGGVDAR
jgi:hypothetical protein